MRDAVVGMPVLKDVHHDEFDDSSSHHVPEKKSVANKESLVHPFHVDDENRDEIPKKDSRHKPEDFDKCDIPAEFDHVVL